MSVNWIDYNGKKILYVDYRETREKQNAIEILHKAVDMEKKSEGNLLILQNFEGAYATNEYIAEVNKLGKEVREKVLKNALVGITGIKKIFLSAYIKISGETSIKNFESEEEAKEWLVGNN